MPPPLKIQSALSVLAETSMRPSSYAPPLHRLLWRLGFNIRPPHFAGFVSNFLATGTWFAVVWGAIMWFAAWARRGMSVGTAISTAIAAGTIFGLLMAYYYRRGARKHSLPSWSEIQGHESNN
jgi:membrane associated rhomboid family serine protease